MARPRCPPVPLLTGSRRPVILAASACARVRCPALRMARPYRHASMAAVSVAAAAAAPSGTSKTAPRYTTGVHARPATERHTASASRGQPAIAAPASSATAARRWPARWPSRSARRASPSRALTPCLVRRESSSGTDHATGQRVAEDQQGRGHLERPPVRRRTTVRSTSDSAPPIWATKWLSTAAVSPPPSSASRISRALYSSRLAVAVYR